MASKKSKVGFFSDAAFKSEKAISDTPQCGACGFHKNSKNPRLPVQGKGRKKILIVTGAVGQYEDKYRKHLVGDPKKAIKQALAKQGIDLYQDCWTTSAIICNKMGRGQDYKNINKKIDKHIEACRPNLLNVIKEYQPVGIILLGSTAAKSLIPVIFKQPVDSNERWNNYVIPCQQYNAWVTFTFYPSGVISERNSAAPVVFNRAIEQFCNKGHKRPYLTVPDYRKKVEIIYNPAKAAKALSHIHTLGKDFAFDYECNCLKPNIDGAKIYSCAVSIGKLMTISYPWKAEAIEATDRLLKSKAGKIAANMKFENRWTKCHLGHYVKNFVHDTMLAAHVLNNKKKASNLTFQAFANFGQPCYDQSVKSFLSSPNSSSLNRIDQIDLKDLLLYGGLDAFLEYKLAMRQRKQLSGRSY